MSEEKGKYDIQQEVDEAMEMLGKGYPTSKRRMSGFESPNYTQTPNDFFEMVPEMGEAELRATLVMIRQTFGFHRDGFKMGLNKLAAAAGLSRNGAKEGAEQAEKRGTFRRTNPEAQTEAEWELVVSQSVTPWSASDHPPLQPVTTPPSAGDPQVRVKERVKKEKKPVLSEKEIQQANAKVVAILGIRGREEQVNQATVEFEKVFGFGTLPWSSNTVWTAFEKFIVSLFQKDAGWTKDYVYWRENDGKYKAFSNRKIRENPAAFMDTGYPEYEASKMYRKAAADEPNLLQKLTEQAVNAVVNPFTKPESLRNT